MLCVFEKPHLIHNPINQMRLRSSSFLLLWLNSKEFCSSYKISKQISQEGHTAAEPLTNDPVQGVMRATNTDNIFAAGRRPVSAAREPMVFMTSKWKPC